MRRATAALFALVALAGCGQGSQRDPGVGDFEGTEKDVAQVVADLAENGRKSDAKAICGKLIASRLAERMKSAGSDCETEMRQAIKDADGFDLKALRVDLQGDARSARNARVQVEGTDRGKKTTQTFTLRLEDKLWKIERFSG